jgi:hypothetical protein
VAVNCCCCPVFKEAFVGEIEIAIGALIVTDTLAVSDEFPEVTAVIVSISEFVPLGSAGAVNKPLAEIVPTVVLPPGI